MKLSAARVSQFFFLGLFLLLFVSTEYRGKDEISLAVNSFFRANPLVAVSYLVSLRSFSHLLVPAVVVLVATALLGRFFCGWICPLGTLLDLIGGYIKRSKPIALLKSGIKYYLLFFLLAAGLFGVNLSGVADPIALLVRFLTFSAYPVVGQTARDIWSGTYAVIGDRRDMLDPVYLFFKQYLLPFRETFYPLAFLSFLLFCVIVALERFERRNWCRNLCPLGTLLGIAGRFSLARRTPISLCGDCGRCRELCPTTFDRDTLHTADCIMCMECSLRCPESRVRFNIRSARAPEDVSFGRRHVIVGLMSGFMVSKLFAFAPEPLRQRLLRPPGVRDENHFLRTCVRCGECMKICLKNALYPSLGESGILGIYTPIIIPRKGYCEYNCTLCGQVCPTKAIPELPPDRKKRAVIGTAVVDKNHCLPFAKKTNCIVCEEHCPVPEKAIRLESVIEKDYAGKQLLLKRPYVVESLCNGCGICEHVCPLEEKAGIEVFATKRNETGDGYGYS